VAYDEGMVTRLREVLAGEPDVDEKRMFGGLTFMVGGHLTVGTRDDRLLVRAGTDDVLGEPGVRPMEQGNGRRMRGWVFVDHDVVSEDADLERWVDLALDVVRSLPPKA
jgi:hypothetical protein